MDASLKICTKCEIAKQLIEFHPQKGRRDGLRSRCKECHNSDCRSWRAKNPDICRNAVKNWTTQNKERHSLNVKKWQDTHKEIIAQRRRDWDKANPERRRKLTYAWRANNVESFRKSNRESARKRRATLSSANKIQDRLHHSVAVLLRRQLLTGKQGKRTFEILGYSIGALKNHLETQFTEGMAWKNYGRWHIDHVKPRVLFSIASIEDLALRECWALSNLQPLWAKDNLSKGAKYA